MRGFAADPKLDLVHRGQGVGLAVRDTSENADSVEQRLDFIGDFPAQFVIETPSRRIDAGLRVEAAGFSTKLSTTSVGRLLRQQVDLLQRPAYTIIGPPI
jgi:hypothetical protein